MTSLITRSLDKLILIAVVDKNNIVDKNGNIKIIKKSIRTQKY